LLAADAALADVILRGASVCESALAADVRVLPLFDDSSDALAFDATGLLVTPLAMMVLQVGLLAGCGDYEDAGTGCGTVWAGPCASL
jgi:hypothetical protein